VKKAAGTVAYILVFLVLVGLSAELLFRFQSPQFFADAPVQYNREVSVRIYRSWLNANPSSPFQPPYVVFANRNLTNEKRLRDVFEKTRLQPSQEWTDYDFLQDPKRSSETRYTIHSNSLGFRGREYTKEKPKGTFRIIALGSYHTFGHGVNDDETYESRLENNLNQKSELKGRKFEVWNGGRHAASAIIGLARMKYEIFDYKPDLLILDYGFVDGYVLDDNTFPIVLRSPDGIFSHAASFVLTPLVPLLANSYLVAKALNSLTNPMKLNKKYLQTLNEMLTFANEHHVPVILLKQFNSPALTSSIYRGFTNDHVAFVDMRDAFAKDPACGKFPSSQDDYGKSTWASEIEPGFMQNPTYFCPFYRLDFFQLNKYGQQKVAETLESVVQEQVLSGRFNL